MAELSKDSFLGAMELVNNYSGKLAKKVIEQENTVDRYEDKLRSYLTRLSGQNLGYADSQNVSTLMHCITDLERISDHAANVVESVQEMNKKEQKFSKKAVEEMEIFRKAISDILERSIGALVNDDEELARTVEPLEEVIDELNKNVKKRHVKRLRKGKCTIELGLVLSDIATNYERVADHCSNIAVYMIQVQDNQLEEHEYMSHLKEEDNVYFNRQVAEFKSQYMLP